jgi:recombination protein RecA
MDIRRIGAIKSGDDVVGNRTKVKVVKNKVAPPFKQVEFNIMYGKGISRLGELLDLAVEYDIIQKRGSWYRYDGDPIGQGQDNAIQYLAEDPKLADQIEEIVRKKLMPEEEQEESTSKKEEKKETAKEEA